MGLDKTTVALQKLPETIHLFRGHKVMLDSTLAALYGVETRRLNAQVRRNRARFPADFLFELTVSEFADLKSQSATSSWGGRRKPPFAFTKHGSIMAAAVLNSPLAIEMRVYVVRTFVQSHELAQGNWRAAASDWRDRCRQARAHGGYRGPAGGFFRNGSRILAESADPS